METIKINKNSVKMVAHRGLSGLEIENTNPAFTLAGKHSYYGIETDIRRTVDGRFVICHDDNLNRIAGEDIKVETSTLEELLKVTLIDKNGGKNTKGIKLSLLEDYLEICKINKKHCVLELKSDFTDTEIQQIIEIIKGYDYLNEVTFISFLYSNLEKVRKFSPNQSAQFLFYNFSEEIISIVIKDRFDVDVKHTALDKEIINRLHENGLKVNCWTVNEKDRAEELVALGVDLITTNILE